MIPQARRHYPLSVYALTVVCGLGLASIALGIADGWVLIAGGVTALTLSLARLHVVLDCRRARVDLRPLPLHGPPVPRRRS